MIKRIIFFILVAISIKNGFCQQIYSCQNLYSSLAHYYNKKNDWVRSSCYLKEINGSEKVHPRSHYSAAIVYFENGDTSMFFAQMKQALKKGVDFEKFEKKKLFDSIKNHPYWKQLKNEEFSKCYTFEELSLIKKIDEIIHSDYFLRNNYYKKNYYNTNSLIDIDKQTIQIQDSLNHLKLKDIFDKTGGFPDYDLIGYERQESLINIILHIAVESNSDSIWNYYYNFEKKAVEEGRLQSKYFADHQDFVHFHYNENEIYGSSMFESRGDSLFMRPIENIENIDIKRLKIGIIPLKFHLENWSEFYKKEIQIPQGYEFNEKFWLQEMREFCSCNCN